MKSSQEHTTSCLPTSVQRPTSVLKTGWYKIHWSIVNFYGHPMIWRQGTEEVPFVMSPSNCFFLFPFSYCFLPSPRSHMACDLNSHSLPSTGHIELSSEQYSPRTTAFNEVGALTACAKHVPIISIHSDSVPVLNTGSKDTLTSNWLPNYSQDYSTLIHQYYQYHNDVQILKVLAHLLSVAMFRSRRIILIYLRPCILNLWSITGCHVDTTDVSN